MAEPQVEGCGLLPVGGESSDFGEFGNVVAVSDQHPERAAGFDGRELCPVADQDDLGADLGRVPGDGVQGEGSGQAGFVNDDQLPSVQIPLAALMLV